MHQVPQLYGNGPLSSGESRSLFSELLPVSIAGWVPLQSSYGMGPPGRRTKAKGTRRLPDLLHAPSK